MKKEDIKLNIHQIFKIIEDSFMFFMVGQNMMAIPSFQKALVKLHDGRMGQIQTSVKFEDESAIKFETSYALNRFNKVTGMKEIGKSVECNIGPLLVQQGILLSIAIFNILESSSYNKKISRSSLFRFSKHLRNGAAHGNKFNFSKETSEKLKQSTVCWRGKEIKETLHGETVFGNFIYLPDLIVLIHDISEELDRIDSKRSK